MTYIYVDACAQKNAHAITIKGFLYLMLRWHYHKQYPHFHIYSFTHSNAAFEIIHPFVVVFGSTAFFRRLCAFLVFACDAVLSFERGYLATNANEFSFRNVSLSLYLRVLRNPQTRDIFSNIRISKVV